MKHIETALSKRIETATDPSRYHTNVDSPFGHKAPASLKEMKMLRKRFGVVVFFDVSDALAYAKGKGFKVINQSGGADAENGPDESDLEFLYEITDKAGRRVGFAQGYANEGEAYICPTAQHYARWEKYQHQ